MTTRRSPSDLLLELGLPEPEASTLVPPLRPAANVSRAFAPAAEPILGARRTGRGSPRPLVWSPKVQVTESLLLEFNQSAPAQVRLWLLDATTGPPSVEAIGPVSESATGFELSSEDPVVALDFRAFDAIYVDWNGKRHLVSAEGDSDSPAVRIATFDLFSLTSATRVAVPAFVEEWLAAAPVGDAWLADHIRALSADGHAAGVVAAVGAWTRLRSRTAAENALLVAKSLRGEVDEAAVAPSRWARSFLVGARRDEVTRSAIGSCGCLAEDLGAVELADPAEASTWTRLAVALRARDDLESTRVMLHAAGAAAKLESCMTDVDAAGDDLVHSLPLEPSLASDEHIARVALKLPDVWWGKPARVSRSQG